MSTSQQLWGTDLCARPDVGVNPLLDPCNEALESQTFSLALEAAGPVYRKSCLDAGCGVGKFSSVLASLGARDITAVDQVLDPRYSEPSIRWVKANLENELRFSTLPLFDLVFALDVLQYVPFAAGLRTLWERVRPGGRLIVVVPNSVCPLVRQAAERIAAARFFAPSPREMRTALDSLAPVSSRAVRGMTFQQDQEIVPYRVDPWGPTADVPPSRWLIVSVKSA